jgi:GT2 family glycosyltransferase
LTKGLPLPSALENYVKFVEDDSVGVRVQVENFAIGGSLFRVQPILEVGGFDCQFIVSSEDTDLAAKLTKNGWKIVNLKTSVFYHSPRTSWRSLFKQYNSWGRNLAVIEKKHGEFEEFSKRKFFMDSFFLLFLSLKYTAKTFESSKDLRCALLPIHYVYKRAAFAFGFFSTK